MCHIELIILKVLRNLFQFLFVTIIVATPVATLGRTPVAGMMATPHMDMQRMTPGSVFMGTPTPYGQTPVAYNQTPAPYGQTPFGAVPTGWQVSVVSLRYNHVFLYVIIMYCFT